MKILRSSLIIFIAFSMLLAVSCSDSSVTDNNTDQCSVHPFVIAEFESTYNVDDFQITVDSLSVDYFSPGIILTVNNPTDKLATCDAIFDVEKLHDGHWDSCQIRDPEFSDHETGIPENGSIQMTYNWDKYFDIIEPGSYRFTTNIIKDAVGNREKIALNIEFSLEYDSVTPVLKSYEISDGSAAIGVNWINNSDGNIYLTDYYTVEALNNGEWVECERTDDEFPLSVFSVAPGGTANKHYTIDSKYELNYYGNYRVYLEYAVNIGDETETRYALIEFFVPYEIH